MPRDGSVLAVLADAEYREPVPLTRVPDHLVTAVIATEDERFFDHGARLRSLARAFFANLRGRREQGGSTITQQLVKNSIVDAERRHSTARSARPCSRPSSRSR